MTKEGLLRAYRRLCRSYQTIDSFWRENKQDNDLTVLRNTMYEAMSLLEDYLEEFGDDVKGE